MEGDQIKNEREEIPGKKKSGFVKIIKLFIGLIFLLLLLIITSGIIISIFYGDEAKAYVVAQVNKQLNTEVIIDPQNIQFSVLKNFPSASVEFKRALALDAIKGNGKKDTLFSAGVISLQFNLMDIFHKKYSVRKLSLSDVVLKLKIYKNGNDNYHFWKTSEATGEQSNFSFALEKINLKNVNVEYVNVRNKQFDKVKINSGSLSGQFIDEVYDLKSNLKLYVSSITSDNVTFLKKRNVEIKAGFSINKKSNSYAVNDGRIKLDNLDFLLSGNMIYIDSTAALDLKIKGQNLNVQSILSFIPGKYKEKINEYSGDGDFQFAAAIKGKYNQNENPLITSNFSIQNGTISKNKSDLAFKNISLLGDYSNQGLSKVTIEKFSGKLNNGTLNGHLSIENFSQPFIKLTVNVDIDLSNFQKFIKLDTIESLQGRAIANLTYEGRLPKNNDGKSVVGKNLKDAVTSGNLELKNVSIRFKNNKLNYDSIQGSFRFDNSDIEVHDFSGRVSESDFSLKGSLKNVLPYMFLENEDLHVDARLKCEKLNLNELLLDEEKTTKRDTVYELNFSEYLHLNLNCHIKEIYFRRFEATDLKGQVVLEDKKMIIDPVSFNTMEGGVSGKGFMDGSKKKVFTIACKASLDKVNINKLFSGLENFGQSTFTDRNIKGFLTAEIQYSSELNARLEANLGKVVATADIKIEKGEILNFEPLKAFSKFINVKDLEDIKFATLENQIEIKKQTIFIPKMDLKNNALNITCSGEHKFNNEIDYHIQLLMRELLAKKAVNAKKENEEFGEVEDDGLSRSLFISMSGTVDKPVIRYDKKGMLKKIKEDIKKEKNNLKDILHEEFGWFKKDSTQTKPKKEEKKKDQKFIIKWDENGKKEKKEDEDF